MTLEQIENLRPDNIEGAISNEEAFFISNIIIQSNIKNAVELGIASGWSSAIILKSLNYLKSINPQNDYHYCGIDIDKYCYYNRSLDVGYLVDSLLAEEEYKGDFHLGKKIFALKDHFKKDEIDFLFIDANHKHPYPAIDLLVSLPYLKNNALVLLHDTNLPIVNPKFPSHGVKYVFDNIDSQFRFSCPPTNKKTQISNLGAFYILNKEKLQKDLLNIIEENKFELEISEQYNQFLESFSENFKTKN